MNIFSVIEDKWNTLCDKTRPFRETMGRGLTKTGNVLSTIGSYLYRMRSVFLAVPVAVAAIWLALVNLSRLPESVGLDLQTDGSFALVVPREVAVFAPLALTALCILMMVLSKKTVYPWLISIFTLVVPVLIYFVNVYPA